MLSLQRFLNQLRALKQDLFFEPSNYWRLTQALINKNNQPIVNQKEIRVTGLRRTGNHAIIGWIRAQHKEPTCHLNNCPPTVNPYQFLYRHYKKEKLARAVRGDFDYHNLLIISYENHNLFL